jgi:hypothetical protein
MLPSIRSGDLLEIEPVDLEGLRRGQIILCRPEPGRVVVHRLIYVRDGAIALQGDSQPDPPEAFELKDALGQVVRVTGRVWSYCPDSFFPRSLSAFWLWARPLGLPLLSVARRLKYWLPR